MKNLYNALSLILLTGALACCAEKPTQQKQNIPQVQKTPTLEAKIAAEPPANDPTSIGERAGEAFINAKGLTDDQRKKLMGVYLHTYQQAMAIRLEIGKSKSLLFKTVSSSAYDSKEVVALTNKIVELDHKRLVLMFKALADVQAIVGYGKDKGEFYRHFYDNEYPGHENLSRNE